MKTDKSLEQTIGDEISNRVKSLSAKIVRIKKDMEELSTEAVELNIYLNMAKQIPLVNLAEQCNMKPIEFNKLKRGCKLTANSPSLNRALLARFGIIN